MSNVTWKSLDPPLSLPPLSKNFGENTSGIAFLRRVRICYYFFVISTHLKVIFKNLKKIWKIQKIIFENIYFHSWKTCAINRSRWVDIFWLIFHKNCSLFHEKIAFWKSLKSMIFELGFLSLPLPTQWGGVMWQKMSFLTFSDHDDFREPT